MATVEREEAQSFPASADLSAHQFKFVVLSSGELALSGDGGNALGVLSDKPAAQGRPGRVVLGGKTKVIAGASFSADADLMSNATGLAITATGAGKYVLCKALEDGVLNQVVEVQMMSHYPIET